MGLIIKTGRFVEVGSMTFVPVHSAVSRLISRFHSASARIGLLENAE